MLFDFDDFFVKKESFFLRFLIYITSSTTRHFNIDHQIAHLHWNLDVDEAARDNVQGEAFARRPLGQLCANIDDVVVHIGAVVELQMGESSHTANGLAYFLVNDGTMKFEMRQIGQMGNVLPNSVRTIGAYPVAVPLVDG